MGLRDALRRSLDPELHRCTPYAMQQCNSDAEDATGAATGVQPEALLPRQVDATNDATVTQPPSCIGVATAEPARVEAQQEAFEERAAIREHDGRQSRPDAERGASADLLRLSRVQADECHAGGWSEGELEAFGKRRTLMQARGYTAEEAEGTAEALVLRDRQGDDRRICLECTNLGERGRCLAAAAGRVAGASRRFEPVPTILQRCEAFGLKKGLQ